MLLPTRRRRAAAPGALFAVLAVSLAPLAGGGPLAAQPLFPDPFVVEHHLVQSDGEGSAFAGDSVTDYYGGSWIVSMRADGSRLVVDLAGARLTEIRPREGSYWSVTFDEYSRLQSAFLASQLGVDAAAQRQSSTGSASPPQVLVREAAPGEPTLAVRGLRPAAVAAAPGVRHLRVVERRGDDEEVRLDVWFDPRRVLSPPARRALERFESAAVGSASPATGAAETAPWRLLAAARERAGGALVVRTVRPVDLGGGARGTVEDVATRVEPVAAFPLDLVEVPDGLRAVSHPLARLLALVEEDAGRQALGGNPAAAGAGEAEPQP